MSHIQAYVKNEEGLNLKFRFIESIERRVYWKKSSFRCYISVFLPSELFQTGQSWADCQMSENDICDFF